MSFFNLIKSKRNVAVILAAIGLVPALSLSVAYAASSTTGSSTAGSSTSSTSSTSKATAAADKLSNIIAKGNLEIGRRLTSLSTLDSKIASSTKLSSSDQAALTTEVSNEETGLRSTKTTLDACSTLSCAQTAAQSIFNEYRVYALVVPQVQMVKVADDQQLNETRLTTMASQLATRVASATNNSALQADLTTMNSDISSAQSLSSTVESSVEALTPSNYDSDHTVLSQYYSDLKTAQSDNQAAAAEAKTIIDALKTS